MPRYLANLLLELTNHNTDITLDLRSAAEDAQYDLFNELQRQTIASVLLNTSLDASGLNDIAGLGRAQLLSAHTDGSAGLQGRIW